jgi:putative copper export protein
MEPRSRFESNLSLHVITRFSHVAMASTAVIVITGVFTAYLNDVSLSNPWSSDDGRLVLGKIFFSGVAMLVAAVNQFLHLRNWKIGNEVQTVRAEAHHVHNSTIHLNASDLHLELVN